tara:strand:+ start:83 stop:502 length:420 start_codon:yes stop_codon:yes gene_type:complete
MDELEKLFEDRNNVKSIINATCLINNISIKDFKNKSRERYLIDSRRMAFAVSKDLLGFGWSRIGREFNLHHASIIHHYKQHQSFLSMDRFYAEKYEAIIELVKFKIGYVDASDIIKEIRLRREEDVLRQHEIKNKINNL